MMYIDFRDRLTEEEYRLLYLGVISEETKKKVVLLPINQLYLNELNTNHKLTINRPPGLRNIIVILFFIDILLIISSLRAIFTNQYSTEKTRIFRQSNSKELFIIQEISSVLLKFKSLSTKTDVMACLL